MKYITKESPAHRFARSFLYPKTLGNTCWSLVTTTFRYLFAEQISLLLLPAQTLTDDPSFINDIYTIEFEFNNTLRKPEYTGITAEKHVIETYDGAMLESLELSHPEQIRKPPGEQQFVIYLVGNGMCYQDILNQCLSDCKDLQWNVLTYNYRNVVRSSGDIKSIFDLISDLISQIERLRSQGVKYENIKIYGHSLGAAIATVVVYIYAQMGLHMKVFNGRSFTQFSDLIYYQYPEGWRRLTWGNLAKLMLKLADMDIDALSAYIAIPQENKSYITVKSSALERGSVPDGVVDERASMDYGLTMKHKRPQNLHTSANDELVLYHGTQVLSFNSIFKCGHNDPVKTLRCFNSEETAQDYYRKFFSGKP